MSCDGAMFRPKTRFGSTSNSSPGGSIPGTSGMLATFQPDMARTVRFFVQHGAFEKNLNYSGQQNNDSITDRVAISS
jgi:hypothetical protein